MILKIQFKESVKKKRNTFKQQNKENLMCAPTKSKYKNVNGKDTH